MDHDEHRGESRLLTNMGLGARGSCSAPLDLGFMFSSVHRLSSVHSSSTLLTLARMLMTHSLP